MQAYDKAIYDLIRELEFRQEPMATPMIPQWMDRAPRVSVNSASGMEGGGDGSRGEGYREYVPGSFAPGYPALFQLDRESQSGASAPQELIETEPSQMMGGNVGKSIGKFFKDMAKNSVPGQIVSVLDKTVKNPRGNFIKELARNTERAVMESPQGKIAQVVARKIGGSDMEGEGFVEDVMRAAKKVRKVVKNPSKALEMIPIAGPIVRDVRKARKPRARKEVEVPAVPEVVAVRKPRKARVTVVAEPVEEPRPVTKEEALAQFPLPPSMAGQGMYGGKESPFLKKVRKYGRAAIKKAEYVATSPFVKGVGKAVVAASKNPLVQKLAVEGAKAALSGGKVDGRKARAAIVKRIMLERGVKMIEASKIVKSEGLY